MADQIATRYGIMSRRLSNAALQTIALTTASAIDALNEVQRRLHCHGSMQMPADSPRDRWDQLLRNLFPASIVLVDPHGDVPPDLLDLPVGPDVEERAVARLITAAASFLLAETTQADEALEDWQDWLELTPGDRADIDETGVILAQATAVCQTMLQSAQVGRWRDLLAARHEPRPGAPAVPACSRRLEPTTPSMAVDVVPEPRSETARFYIVLDYHYSNEPPQWLSLVKTLMKTLFPSEFDVSREAYLQSMADRLWTDPVPCTVDSMRMTGHPLVVDLTASRPLAPAPRWNITPAPRWDSPWTTDSLGASCHAADAPSTGFSPTATPDVHSATAMRSTAVYSTTGAGKSDFLLALALLDDFGQRQREQRQAVIDHLCAYLRTSLATIRDERHLHLPASLARCAEPVAVSPGWKLDLRDIVQRLLALHLRPGPNLTYPVTTYWDGMDVDLTDAVLTDFNLSGCQLRAARFTGARFHGNTSFTGTRFVRWTDFSHARFDGPAQLAGTRFHDDARFDHTQFTGDAAFPTAVFDGDVRFDHTEFSRAATFDQVAFHGDARFDHARFGGQTVFCRSVFASDARLQYSQFAGDTSFDEAMFARLARFDHSVFLNGIRFWRTQFAPADDWGDEYRSPPHPAVEVHGQCWVRTDVPTEVEPRRVWPQGWSVHSTGQRPPDQHEGNWGRLLPTEKAAA